MKQLIALLTLSCSYAVMAQEPTFMEAGTHPGRYQLYQRLIATHAPDAVDRADDWQATLKTAYGFTARTALLADWSIDGRHRNEASLRLKQRFWQRDTGPIDTWRASVQGGIEWFEGADLSPRLGIVSTTIRGRHGVNAQLDWRDGTKPSERFAVNASHLYRIHPARFRPNTSGAWYTMIESLNALSDHASPTPGLAIGLLYEARRWAAEISVKSDDITESSQRTNHQWALGARYLW